MGSCAPQLGQTVGRFSKPNRYVNVVFLHCSATSNTNTDANTVNGWHVNDNGWDCIGYHIFVKSDGTPQYGRDMERTPAAQSGYNEGSIAICLNGLNPEDFTSAQFNWLRDYCAQINTAYGQMRFRGHKEVAAKACPVFDYAVVLGLDSYGYMTGEVQPPPPSEPPHEMMISRVVVSSNQNSRHYDVKLAQGLLLSAGQNPGVVDGIYGANTANAISSLQRAHGLTVNGICDSPTWEILEDAGK